MSPDWPATIHEHDTRLTYVPADGKNMFWRLKIDAAQQIDSAALTGLIAFGFIPIDRQLHSEIYDFIRPFT